MGIEGVEIFEAAVLQCDECDGEWPDYGGGGDGAPCSNSGCHGHLKHMIEKLETWVPVDRWWWWPCQPGALPDGEAAGPFLNEDEAEADARDDDETGAGEAKAEEEWAQLETALRAIKATGRSREAVIDGVNLIYDEEDLEIERES